MFNSISPVSYAMGNYSIMFHSIKNASRRSALQRKRIMSLKRPAAGGESRKRDSLFSDNISGRLLYSSLKFRKAVCIIRTVALNTGK